MKRIRRLINLHSPKITRDSAIAIAESECNNRQWPWLEPIKVSSTVNTWIIFTNSEARGANVRIKVHKNSGEILEAKFMPR